MMNRLPKPSGRYTLHLTYLPKTELRSESVTTFPAKAGRLRSSAEAARSILEYVFIWILLEIDPHSEPDEITALA